MKPQTRPPVSRHTLTRPQPERLFHNRQNIIPLLPRHKRPEKLSRPRRLPGDRNPGKPLLRQLNIRITLRIPQINVILRLMALNETVLQEIRLLIRPRNNILHIRNRLHQLLRLRIMIPLLKIRRNPLAHIPVLSHTQDPPLPVLMQITHRTMRNISKRERKRRNHHNDVDTQRRQKGKTHSVRHRTSPI